jgi:dolichol-phosphate mannosyltransferase
MLRKKILIVLPALNEEKVVEYAIEIITKIKENFPSVDPSAVIVDDGSSSPIGPVKFSRQGNYEISVIRHQHNQGLGGALRTGISSVIGSINEDDLIITMESDQTVNLEDILSGIERFSLKRNSPDVVLLSVYKHGGSFRGVARNRIFFSKTANLVSRLIFGLSGIWTLTSLNRIYSGKSILALHKNYGNEMITQRGFEVNLEMLAKLVKLDAKVEEIPTVVDQSNRIGSSKLKIGKTIFRYMKLFLNRNSITGSRNGSFSL